MTTKRMLRRTVLELEIPLDLLDAIDEYRDFVAASLAATGSDTARFVSRAAVARQLILLGLESVQAEVLRMQVQAARAGVRLEQPGDAMGLIHTEGDRR